MTNLNSETRVGRFTLTQSLGSGSMGRVYRAQDPVRDREVTIKVVEPDAFENEVARSSFLNEARAAARLQHPNLVSVFEVGEDGESLFLVMEVLRGQTLAVALANRFTAPLADCLEIVRQVCAGLEFALEHGIAHRSLHPANIWLCDDGSVKVLDLGWASGEAADAVHEATERVSYLSSEQVSGHPADARSDVFALGVILYELTIGRKPFPGASATAIMLRIAREPPARMPAAIPEGLRAIIDRALQKDPAERYASAAELVAALDELLYATPPLEEEPTQLLPRQPDAGDPRRAESARLPPGMQSQRRRRLDGRWIGVAAAAAVLVTSWAVWSRVGTTPVPSAAIDVATSRPPATPEPPPEPEPEPEPPILATPLELDVRSTPAGASIFVDGRDSGLTTPARVQIDRGPQPKVIRLTKSGFEPGEVPIDSAALTTRKLSATLVAIPDAPVRLVISAGYPFEILEGQQVVSERKNRHDLPMNGRHALRLRDSRYFQNMAVTLDPRSGPLRTIELPPPTRLSVRAAPHLERCAVWLDNRRLDFPPINNQEVAPGKHLLQLRCEAGDPVDHQIELLPGTPLTESFR